MSEDFDFILKTKIKLIHFCFLSKTKLKKFSNFDSLIFTKNETVTNLRFFKHFF